MSTNDLTAGPELDAAVAKACGIEQHISGFSVESPDGCLYRHYAYSTDLNAAFEAAEKVRLFHYRAMFYCPHSGWHIVKCDELDHLGRGSRGPLTPQLAICRAILALHGDK